MNTRLTSYPFSATGGSLSRSIPERLAPAYPYLLNVKDFGVFGDDSHDDTAAIQALITATSDNVGTRGNILYFPPGIYKVSAPLDVTPPSSGFNVGNCNLQLVGAGRDATVIKGFIPTTGNPPWGTYDFGAGGGGITPAVSAILVGSNSCSNLTRLSSMTFWNTNDESYWNCAVVLGIFTAGNWVENCKFKGRSGFICTASFGTNFRSVIAESILPLPTADAALPNPILNTILQEFPIPPLPDSIATSQSPGAGAIVLNGSSFGPNYVPPGAQNNPARPVYISSSGNDSGINFTVFGSLGINPAEDFSETIAGGNGTFAVTSNHFGFVTRVTHTGTISGTVKVGVRPIFNAYPGSIGLQLFGLCVTECCKATGFDIGFSNSGPLSGCHADRCGVGIYWGVSASPLGIYGVGAASMRSNKVSRCLLGIKFHAGTCEMAATIVEGNQGPADPATISSMVWNSGTHVVTVTTAANHNIPTNTWDGNPTAVLLSVNPSAFVPRASGLVVATVTGANTFTYPGPASSPGSFVSGTWNYPTLQAVQTRAQDSAIKATLLDAVASQLSVLTGGDLANATGELNNNIWATRGNYGWDVAATGELPDWKRLSCGGTGAAAVAVADNPFARSNNAIRPVMTFGTLPGQPGTSQPRDETQEYWISNGPNVGFGAVVSTTGSIKMKVRFDGTNWICIARYP
jgi:hypothetical protein